MRWSPEELHQPREPGLPLSIGQLGMVLLLASISVLFFASCAAVLITFYKGASPPGTTVATGSVPPLPWGLVASTLFLAGVSYSLERGLRSVRSGDHPQAQFALRAGGILAALFLVAQGLNCVELLAVPGSSARHSLFLFSFNLLVGLHAVHVLGGVVYLFICFRRMAGGDHTEGSHQALKYCVQYWHYLGLVWIPLVATLLWVS